MDLRETLAVLREAGVAKAELVGGELVSVEFAPDVPQSEPATSTAPPEDDLPWNARDAIADANFRKKDQPDG